MTDDYIVQGVKCCLCSEVINGYGNVASPVKDGICCDNCNLTIVVPARMREALQ